MARWLRSSPGLWLTPPHVLRASPLSTTAENVILSARDDELRSRSTTSTIDVFRTDTGGVDLAFRGRRVLRRGQQDGRVRQRGRHVRLRDRQRRSDHRRRRRYASVTARRRHRPTVAPPSGRGLATTSDKVGGDTEGVSKPRHPGGRLHVDGCTGRRSAPTTAGGQGASGLVRALHGAAPEQAKGDPATVGHRRRGSRPSTSWSPWTTYAHSFRMRPTPIQVGRDHRGPTTRRGRRSVSTVPLTTDCGRQGDLLGLRSFRSRHRKPSRPTSTRVDIVHPRSSWSPTRRTTHRRTPTSVTSVTAATTADYRPRDGARWCSRHHGWRS